MIRLSHLVLASVLAAAAPGAALAQWGPWGSTNQQFGFTEGRERGERAGADDARRGDPFGFVDETDYRRGDVGYRSQYGDRERYRDAFRNGFQQGYRLAYGRDAYNAPGGRYGDPRGGYEGPGNNGRGIGWGRGRANSGGRFDLAYQTGESDGYYAGLDDGRDGRRFDPTAESRYRSADREYDRRYGTKAEYQQNYRLGFQQGYTEGYETGRRYR